MNAALEALGATAAIIIVGGFGDVIFCAARAMYYRHGNPRVFARQTPYYHEWAEFIREGNSYLPLEDYGQYAHQRDQLLNQEAGEE